jgi:aspartyl-tRNA(Asn)/glutamyl-tRNA(Gln) amidotransferase subunit C
VSVTRQEVEAIAALARLRLEPGEADRLAVQLSGILSHMDELMQADIDGVPPFGIPAADVAPSRSDEVGADPLHAALDEIAPSWVDGFFTVPRLAAQRGRDDVSPQESA